MKHTRLALAVTATALVLAGCSAESDDPTPSPAASIANPATTSVRESASAEVPGDTKDKVSPASEDARLSVVEIRTGRHDGFDRVVYELAGEGTPGWRVGYVNEATQQGSGNEVAVSGDAVLEVLIDGSTYPFEIGLEPYGGPDPLVAEPGGSVVEVTGSGVFEGVTQSFVGIAERGTPFTVYSLTNPTRVVIDVAR
ncbi:hypothetical protein OED52_06115 [Rhodococcus sp. Z13]|uniref:Uncharacterized protein n=1 Tax=Rhodococcus sacchari TaxID=2962047 RepID=A0ACD4DJ61_9NOCA|nr:hypothetical protein [Rhodococcus sp. Z13]UYP20115.1 hypothetical protein OED52_06115 [Rhodococcus sp. Z13]